MGVIDKNSNLVIDSNFQDIRDFNEQGCVFVKMGNQWRMLKLIKENYD